MLNTSDAKFVEEGSDVVVGKLNTLAIYLSSPCMRRMLGASWFFVAKFGKSMGDVVRHGDINPAFVIIPAESETKIGGA